MTSPCFKLGYTHIDLVFEKVNPRWPTRLSNPPLEVGWTRVDFNANGTTPAANKRHRPDELCWLTHQANRMPHRGNLMPLQANLTPRQANLMPRRGNLSNKRVPLLVIWVNLCKCSRAMRMTYFAGCSWSSYAVLTEIPIPQEPTE